MKTKSNSKQLLDFYNNYVQEILPILKDLEETRLDTLNKFNKKSFNLYCLPIIIIFCLLIISSFEYNSSLTECIQGALYPTLIIPILIFPFIYFYERSKENEKFTKTLKIKVFQKLLDKLGNIKWIGQHNNINTDTEQLSSKLLKKSGLFLHFNTRRTDDEFKGLYKNVPFVISETKMWTINRKNQTVLYSTFEGIILSFKCNKKIKNRTIISTKGDLTQKNQKFITSIIFTWVISSPAIKHLPLHLALTLLLVLFIILYLIISIIPVNEKEKLDRVNLEDPCFSKRFDVFSSDQIEARYLITTSFMERFYNLKTTFGANKIKCSFFDDVLMIAIHTNKNLFEICSLFKSLKDPSSIKECYKEINSIYELIESLKLDEKTGL